MKQRAFATIRTMIAVPTFFLFLGAWPFFDPDEGRYAQMPHEMGAAATWSSVRCTG